MEFKASRRKDEAEAQAGAGAGEREEKFAAACSNQLESVA